MAASDDFDDSTRRISPDDLAEEPATNRKMPTAVDAGVQPGDVLVGKYRVERMLGRGGMGVVVAAHHLQLDEKVALKFLLPETIQDARAVARFLREARATVKIKGEHVARVLDVGQLESGSPYIVMEYLEGVDLAGWLKQRGPLPIALAVDFVLQACEAVADAHAVGIVHRDLKPANLFCVERSDGQLSIKVLDFGISKVTTPGAPGHDMTGTTALVGTPFYMSPEQMQASKSVDARTDIWALGVILFELVTGRPPFDGQTLTELAIRVANEPAPPARALRSDVPLGLDEIIATCLTKARDGRYPSIAELAIALKDFGSKNARLSVERVRRGAAFIADAAVAADGDDDGGAADGGFVGPDRSPARVGREEGLRVDRRRRGAGRARRPRRARRAESVPGDHGEQRRGGDDERAGDAGVDPREHRGRPVDDHARAVHDVGAPDHRRQRPADRTHDAGLGQVPGAHGPELVVLARRGSFLRCPRRSSVGRLLTRLRGYARSRRSPPRPTWSALGAARPRRHRAWSRRVTARPRRHPRAVRPGKRVLSSRPHMRGPGTPCSRRDHAWSGPRIAHRRRDRTWSDRATARSRHDQAWSGRGGARSRHDHTWSDRRIAPRRRDHGWSGPGTAWSRRDQPWPGPGEARSHRDHAWSGPSRARSRRDHT
jgi:serine/threonine-protein kinase